MVGRSVSSVSVRKIVDMRIDPIDESSHPLSKLIRVSDLAPQRISDGRRICAKIAFLTSATIDASRSTWAMRFALFKIL